MLKNIATLTLAVVALAACNKVSYVQQESPNNPYKESTNEPRAAVLGVGEPLSKRQMAANATLDLNGNMQLEDAMRRIASTFNVAIRWGDGVRKDERQQVLVSDLTFNEVRSYLEDVFDVQLVREGERRLLILPATDERRVEVFSPGINVSLSQAVRGLAQQCEMNLVINENKERLANTSVTTSLRDVTCRDAFRALLGPHGLSLVDKGSYFLIGGLPTRQWRVNLYEPIREELQEISYESESTSEAGEGGGGNTVGGRSEINVTYSRDLWAELESDLTDLLNNSCGNGAVANPGTTTTGTGSEVLPPPGLETAAATFSTVDTTTQTATSSSIGSGGSSGSCGYVRVNRSVGTVQMQAGVDVLSSADEIIRQLEDIASRRLLVEARVLAVTRTRGFNQDGALQAGVRVGDATLGTTFDNTSSIVGSVNGVLRNLTTGVTGGAFSASGDDIDSVVRLVESFGTTYQLMRPTMEVMDRQRAILIDGTNRKYFLINTTQQVNDDGSNGDETTEVEERTQFVGLQFSVSAQIADEGEPHTVALQIPITDVADEVTIPDGTNSIVPIVTTRMIDQKVRLRDGEIKAIGGLTRTLAVDNESGVPLIRGVPAFGKLFNEESITYEEVEFVVLLQVRRLF